MYVFAIYRGPYRYISLLSAMVLFICSKVGQCVIWTCGQNTDTVVTCYKHNTFNYTFKLSILNVV